MDARTSRRRQRRWAIVRITCFIVWTIIVAGILLWQTTAYDGVMSLIGEWQFDAFGRQYPTFNYVALVFLLCLPGYLLFLKPRRLTASEQLEAATVRSARTLLRIVLGTVAVLGAAMIVTLILLLVLPNTNGAPQTIDLAKPQLSAPVEGPVIISGSILYERTAGVDSDLLLARRDVRFAPIVGSRSAVRHLQFFVQLPTDSDTVAQGTPIRGVLRRNGLPGELVRLFRYAGFIVESPDYVIFTEPAAMRWPYWMAMAQFCIGAVLALLVGLLQRRSLRRIEGEIYPVEPKSAAPVA